MSKYYCLIAGLPDINLDDQKQTYTIASFKEEAYPQLSEEDKKTFDLFFYQYDNINLLRFLQDKEALFVENGMFSREQIEVMVKEMKESEEAGSTVLPYFRSFVSAYLEDKPLAEGMLWQDQLAGLYYAYAQSAKNKFVAQWYELNLNINNILVALTGRKFHFDTVPYIVGDNDVAVALRNSNARDFGLSGELDYFDAIQRISEEPDTYQRERKVDMFRWQWLEENTFFDYFTIERVFAYLLKVHLIERWYAMNRDLGEQKFREVLNTLKQEVVVPQEFKVNK